jgi:hypothetical protein
VKKKKNNSNREKKEIKLKYSDTEYNDKSDDKCFFLILVLNYGG